MMNHARTRIGAALTTLVLSMGVAGGVTDARAAGVLQDDMVDFLDDIGAGVNTTGASVYKSQSRTYLNGGGLFMRVPQRNVDPITINRPSLRGGCTGIDFYGGGMSFIESDELVEQLESIGTGTIASMAFMVGLRTISPALTNTIEKLQDWKSKLNLDSINTCETANMAANALTNLAFNEQGKSACITSRMQNHNEAYDEARKACGEEDKIEGAMETEEAQETGFIVGNLVWKVMHNNDMFTGENNREMRELIMSLTGTIVKTEDASEASVYASKLNGSDELLNVILHGGQTERYQCGGDWGEDINKESGCTAVLDSPIAVSTDQGLYVRTRSAMERLYNDIRTGSKPEPDDYEYAIFSTNVPVQKVLTVAAGIGRQDETAGRSLISKYSELVAIEMLFTYVNRLVDAVEVQTYQDDLGDDGEKMREMIRDVRKHLKAKYEGVRNRMSNALHIAEEMRLYEQMLITNMPASLASSYRWSGTR